MNDNTETTTHLSKYALKQKKLREEKGFGHEYEISTEEHKQETETLAQAVQRQQENPYNLYGGLSEDDKKRLIGKWSNQNMKYKEQISEFLNKIYRLKADIEKFNKLIKRNEIRIRRYE